jgi:hypothetical protein
MPVKRTYTKRSALKAVHNEEAVVKDFSAEEVDDSNDVEDTKVSVDDFLPTSEPNDVKPTDVLPVSEPQPLLSEEVVVVVKLEEEEVVVKQETEQEQSKPDVVEELLPQVIEPVVNDGPLKKEFIAVFYGGCVIFSYMTVITEVGSDPKISGESMISLNLGNIHELSASASTFSGIEGDFECEIFNVNQWVAARLRVAADGSAKLSRVDEKHLVHGYIGFRMA